MSDAIQNNINATKQVPLLATVFSDAEAKDNIVGFFDLLLKIDRRNHPEKYD